MHNGHVSITRKTLAALIGAALLGAAGNVQAETCTSSQETALNVKRLQTELMVAALSCGARADYNAFVRNFKPDLSSQGKVLQSLFSKTYGSKGQRVLDTHVTRLANQASRGHMEDVRGYCARAAAAFSALNAENSRATLVRLSTRSLAGNGLAEGPCRASSPSLQQAHIP